MRGMLQQVLSHQTSLLAMEQRCTGYVASVLQGSSTIGQHRQVAELPGQKQAAVLCWQGCVHVQLFADTLPSCSCRVASQPECRDARQLYIQLKPHSMVAKWRERQLAAVNQLPHVTRKRTDAFSERRMPLTIVHLPLLCFSVTTTTALVSGKPPSKHKHGSL